MNPKFTMSPEAIDALLDRAEYGTLALSVDGDAVSGDTVFASVSIETSL